MLGTSWDKQVFIWLPSCLFKKHFLFLPWGLIFPLPRTLFHSFHTVHSFILFRSLLKCHPLREVSLIILHKITSYPIPSHPIFLYPVSSAYFLYSTFQYLKSYTCLLVNCLTLQCKRHDSQNFIYSTRNLQHIERRSVENCWMKSVFKK